jgi:hypothetical protein
MSFPRNTALGAIVGAALLAAATPVGAATIERPYTLEAVPGSPLKRVVLTQKAAQRIDIQTGQVATAPSGKLIAPYRALQYDTEGRPWVYINPEPLSFVRHKVTVERIEGDTVTLVEGPPPGTPVVTVGVAELYGAERGVGH